MGDLPGIVITGASGRMGQMLIRMIAASDKARLVGCVERSGHDWVGRDVGEAMGGSPIGVKVTDDALDAFSRAQAVVDFTSPAASVDFAALAAQARAEAEARLVRWLHDWDLAADNAVPPPPGARARSINHTCITDSSLSCVDDISLEVTESVGATD